MAEFVLTDAFLYAGGYDFTTDTNSATLTLDAAALDATTFNSGGWTEQVGGLKSSNLAWSGFWSSASGVSDQAPDNQAFPMLATSQPYTFGPVETEGQVAYMFNAMKSSYSQGASVGELAPFGLSAVGASPDGTIRGRLSKARGTVASTGAIGTGVNVGALSSTQSLYATLHLFTVGTTITVTLQSDDNSGFTSPTVLATFGPLTASGGTWMTKISGPITDTWYRFVVTAITGSFTLAGAIGKG
jgi:hypothetical protein